jgi:hypothetical protein
MLEGTLEERRTLPSGYSYKQKASESMDESELRADIRSEQVQVRFPLQPNEGTDTETLHVTCC